MEDFDGERRKREHADRGCVTQKREVLHSWKRLVTVLSVQVVVGDQEIFSNNGWAIDSDVLSTL